MDLDDEELESTKRLNGISKERMKYKKYRFKTRALEDYRPLLDMKEIQCPWWCSGEGSDYAIIICYLPQEEDLYKYWDDAYDIDEEETNQIVYTDRFKKPDYIK